MEHSQGHGRAAVGRSPTELVQGGLRGAMGEGRGSAVRWQGGILRHLGARREHLEAESGASWGSGAGVSASDGELGRSGALLEAWKVRRPRALPAAGSAGPFRWWGSWHGARTCRPWRHWGIFG
jgi:hypothetical protein